MPFTDPETPTAPFVTDDWNTWRREDDGRYTLWLSGCWGSKGCWPARNVLETPFTRVWPGEDPELKLAHIHMSQCFRKPPACLNGAHFDPRLRSSFPDRVSAY